MLKVNSATHREVKATATSYLSPQSIPIYP
jgi:hypothetical protein